MVTDTTERMPHPTDLPKDHPVVPLLERRDVLVSKRARCIQTVENAKRNMLLHKAMADDQQDSIRKLDIAIKAVLASMDTSEGG